MRTFLGDGKSPVLVLLLLLMPGKSPSESTNASWSIRTILSFRDFSRFSNFIRRFIWVRLGDRILILAERIRALTPMENRENRAGQGCRRGILLTLALLLAVAVLGIPGSALTPGSGFTVKTPPELLVSTMVTISTNFPTFSPVACQKGAMADEIIGVYVNTHVENVVTTVMNHATQKVVRKWTDPGLSTAGDYLHYWNGNDQDSGQIVPDGLYNVSAVALVSHSFQGPYNIYVPVLASGSSSIVIDSTPPVTTARFDPPFTSTFPGDVTITLTASDSGRGVEGVFYKIDSSDWIMNWNTATTTFTVTGEGSHTIAFYSRDKVLNLETEHDVSFTIAPVSVPAANIPPVASFTAIPTSGTAPLEVRFISTSSDADGSITGYSWAFGDGSTGSGASVDHVFTGEGTYTATLRVTDNGNPQQSSISDPVTITVSSAGTVSSSTTNSPPVASFTASPLSGTAPLSVRFISTSSDPDGFITRYSWDFGDGSTGSGATGTHRFTRAGSFDVTLVVTDDGNPPLSSTSDPMTIKVSGSSSGSSSGKITVVSQPSGATVYVDNLVKGRTPCVVGDVDPGTHHLSVELLGYNPWTADVRVGAGVNITIPATLTALPGTPTPEATQTGMSTIPAVLATGLYVIFYRRVRR